MPVTMMVAGRSLQSSRSDSSSSSSAASIVSVAPFDALSFSLVAALPEGASGRSPSVPFPESIDGGNVCFVYKPYIWSIFKYTLMRPMFRKEATWRGQESRPVWVQRGSVNSYFQTLYRKRLLISKFFSSFKQKYASLRKLSIFGPYPASA